MVSDRSLQILGWAINAGSRLMIFPAIFDSKRQSIIMKQGEKLHIPWNPGKYIYTGYIVSIITYISYILHMMYLLGFLIFFEHSEIDMCLALYMITAFYMELTSHLSVVLLHFEEFCSLCNEFLLLDMTFRKSHFNWKSKLQRVILDTLFISITCS